MSPLSPIRLLLLLPWIALAAPGDVPLSPVRTAPLVDIGTRAIASSGQEYLIVLEQHGALLWQRVALDGTPLDATPRLIEGATLSWPIGMGLPARAVWTGERYLVAWTEGRSVVGALVERHGAASLPFTISSAPPHDDACGSSCSGDGLRDLDRSASEIALLAMLDGRWKLITLDAAGSKLTEHEGPVVSSDMDLVHLDGGWRIARRSGSDLLLLDPQTGIETTHTVAAASVTDVIASAADGGALILTAGKTIHVLRPDGEIVRAQVPELDHLRQGLVAPAPDGWTLLYPALGDSHIATITIDGSVTREEPLTGPFPDRGALLYFSLVAASASLDQQLFIQTAPGPYPTVGIESIVVRNGRAAYGAALAVGDAAQREGAVAAGPGIDLVVWLESSSDGWDLRATRVRDGMPLDGDGVLIDSGSLSKISATFDGRDFAVLWVGRGGIRIRRVSLGGQLVEPEPIPVAPLSPYTARMASRGDGTVLVTYTDALAYTSLVTAGSASAPVSVGRWDWTVQAETGASPEGYLVAIGNPIHACNILCSFAPQEALVQLLTPAGEPAGALHAITDKIGWDLREPVHHSGDWFVPVRQDNGMFVVRLSSSALPKGGSFVPARSRLRDAEQGLGVWSGLYRGMMSAEGANLWYEPLPIKLGEELALDPLDESETMLLQSGSRLFLRPLRPHVRNADIAVVHVSRERSGTTNVDTIRIEHRGGDVVPSMSVTIQGGSSPNGAGAPLIESSRALGQHGAPTVGPFVPGEVIEITARWSSRSTTDLVISALPDTREVAAGDNFLVLERLHPRRRAARR